MSADPLAMNATASKGAAYERIAFTFCRAGTIVLFAQLLLGERWVLPLIAITTAVLYGVAYVYGKRDTRCILRIPWVIILFWGIIGAAALWLIARQLPWPSVL